MKKTETVSTICRPELDISLYFMYNTRDYVLLCLDIVA
jgi:hypothetical protein